MVNLTDILNARILVVDDQEANVLLLEQMLSRAGYNSVTSTMDPGKVCELYLKNRYDLILLDLQMPGMDGFQVMEGLKAIEAESYVPVLVITAQPGHKLRALEAGAKDFISKPFDLVEVTTRIHNILEVRLLYNKIENDKKALEQTVQERTGDLLKANVRLTQEIEERKSAEESLQGAYAEIKLLKDRLQAENIYLQQEVAREYNFGEIIGQSNALSHVFLRVEQVAPMNATVLLIGETGTGKGVVARAIHSSSARKDRPMITVNCTSLPANLIESELFGRERGAFTGANVRQIGRFELADGGTIFLDEIGEMPLELQSKLLRVIQDGEFERLGNPRTIKVDVRIIAASNRNLKEEIRAGRFREDLFYRLNVFPITIPPLRQRIEDIPLLVNHFVAKFNKKIGKKIETVSKNTLNALQEYHWPGNVRELESVIERAVITSQGNALQVLDRFDTFRKTDEPTGEEVKALAELEQDHILQVLQKTGWQINGKNGAAVILGLNPSTLRARMQKYGIIRQ
jgi:formate hydrogenlyase transcriptional activator